MKIFHGPLNIAGQAGVLARAQRKLGFDAWAFCYSTGFARFSSDWQSSPPASMLSALKLLWLIFARERNFDCFHFYFGHSLAGYTLLDIPLLKKVGKKVFFYFCGCDARDSKFEIKNHEISACSCCWPMLCSANRREAIRVAREFADGIFVSTPDLLEFIPEAVLLPQPIDLDDLHSHLKGIPVAQPMGRPLIDRPVRVAHAPSDSNIKGTKFVVAAVEKLRKKAINVELVLMQNKTHDEVLSIYATCDIVVDQLLVGAYGLVAVEAMAFGKPVICYIRDDLIPLYPPGMPVISAGPKDIYDVLGDWVTHPEWWNEKGSAAKEYVESVHDAEVVAKMCIDCYETRV